VRRDRGAGTDIAVAGRWQRRLDVIALTEGRRPRAASGARDRVKQLVDRREAAGGGRTQALLPAVGFYQSVVTARTIRSNASS
jgi:hypothetical protein